MLPHFQLSLLLLSVVIATCSCDTVIDIDSSAPSGSQSNLFHHLCTVPEQLQSDTVMVLSSGMYEIDDGPSCVVSNINNLTIRGVDTDNFDNVSELSCRNNSLGRNFIFLNITNLIFENLVVSGCGAYIPQGLPSYVNDSFVYFGEKQKAVFLFAQVTNLYIEDVIMYANYGYGIVGVNLLGDTRLDLVHIHGNDNTLHPLCSGEEIDFSCTGTGALFSYSDPSTDNSFVANNGTLIISNSFFDFNQHFVPNIIYVTLFTVATSPFRTERGGIVGGVGVTVYSGQRSYLMDVQVRDSVFRNNIGDTSSLMLVSYNSIRETAYRVDHCTFQNNIGLRGGGLFFVAINFIDALGSFPEYPNDVHTILSVTDSEFVNNIAYSGGAVFFHMSPQNVTDYRIEIDSVSFVGNLGTFGSCIYSASNLPLFIPRSNAMSIQDVTVTNNTFPDTLISSIPTIDYSAAFVFALIDNVTISGREGKGSLFSHNSPGAVLITGGKLFVRGHIEFSDNLAFRGGALALFDYTVLHIHEGSRIKFKRNHAVQTGGAIFANSLGTGVLDVCVIQIVGTHRISDAADTDLLDLQLRFENNSADVAGNSIYASPLYSCAYLPEASTIRNVFSYTEQDIYNAIFNFETSVQNGNQEISSVPTRISFCENFTSVPDQHVKNVTSFPGKTISLWLVPLDPILTQVQSVMYAEIQHTHNEDKTLFDLGPAQSTQRLSGRNCSLIDFNVYGPEDSEGDIHLYARLGGIDVAVVVTLGMCPPGFYLTKVNGLSQCTCSDYVKQVVQTSCNTSTYTVLRPGRGWIGMTDYANTSSLIWVDTCPIGHCNPDIQDVDLLVQDQICEPGRSGKLCGQCREGLSVVFGSATCMQCTHYWLFSIIIYAIVGFLIVVVLFLLNLTVTKGTINGLIFYVNVVSVNSSVFFKNKASFDKVFVSLLNLELGFPVCFFDGMDEAAKTGLQFVFPVYLLVICLMLILLSRWSSRVQKLTSNNGIAVVVTIMYLSYGKFLRAVVDCLSFATIRGEFGTSTIWLYDGSLEYFTGVHIVLGLAALVATIVFLIPYTVPLVFIRQIEKHSIRFKPLFDAYGGPYKDKYRYWFGLRLILLAAMCLTYAIAGTDFQSLALSLETFFLLWFTVWQAYAKPYKNRAIAILDLFFLINFLTMSIWVLHLVEDVNISQSATLKRVGVVTFLIALAFIATIGILVYHLYLAIYERVPKFQERMDKLSENIRSVDSYQRFKQLKYLVTGGAKSAMSNEDTKHVKRNVELKDVTQTEVTFSCAIDSERGQTFSGLREPVLDYDN